jgi:hypothetical protein
MAAAPVSLDNGPPLPPNLQPQPQPTMAGLAGPQAQPGAPSGSASLQTAVIQKLMFAEQALNDVATMMPAAAGPINGVIDMLRKGVGAVLAKGAMPPPAPGPLGTASTMIAGPQGGAGGAPTS